MMLYWTHFNDITVPLCELNTVDTDKSVNKY